MTADAQPTQAPPANRNDAPASPAAESSPGSRTVQPRRERIEWSDIWVVNANKDNLPRVLLVGDSITRQYFGTVEKALEGEANLARCTTSKFLGAPDYLPELEILLRSYRFDVIHINNGLHGFGYTEGQYKDGFPPLLGSLKKYAPDATLIWATTTPDPRPLCWYCRSCDFPPGLPKKK